MNAFDLLHRQPVAVVATGWSQGKLLKRPALSAPGAVHS
jgi:hypothetical protein